MGSSGAPPLGSSAHQHPRAADGELEALAAHGLDQHRELKLATAGDLEGAVVRHAVHLDRDIALGFAGEGALRSCAR